MAKLGKAKPVQMTATYSHSLRWDPDGLCYEAIDGAPETRRPDCDYGTPNGDLIIDPWIQEAVRKADG